METHPNHLKIDTLVWEPTAQVELKVRYLVSQRYWVWSTYHLPNRVSVHPLKRTRASESAQTEVQLLPHIQPWSAGSFNEIDESKELQSLCAHALISRLTNSLWARNPKVPTPTPVFPMFHGQCKQRLDRVVSSKNESGTWGPLSPIDSRHQAHLLSNIPVALYSSTLKFGIYIIVHHSEHLWNLALGNSFLQFDRKAASKTSTCPLPTHKHDMHCVSIHK